MKKAFFLLPCIAAVAIATFVGAKTFKSNAIESDDLLMANVEALASGDAGGSFRYPDKSGSAQFCKLYVYMKAGVVVSKGTEENPQYEGRAEYEKRTTEGLKDRCPNRGGGCNPFSCQEVAY